MKNFLTLILFLSCGIIKSQTLILGSQLPGASPIRTTNGCTTGCSAYCSPTGTGNHVATPCTGILTVPALQYISITIVTNECDSGSGLDGGDNVTINGVNDPAAPFASNELVNYSGCFFNSSNVARDIPIVLIVNRRDETVTVSGTVSATDPGGCITLAPLPVKFSIFDLENKGKSNNLSFSTLSEVNNDYFTIERSVDGRTFDDIAKIAGAGNSSEELNYQYNDNTPANGVNYYRIRQTDYDGKSDYSEIKSVTVGSRDAFAVNPRSTYRSLDISTDALDYEANLYNISGQLVKTFTQLSANQTIDIEDMTSGLYYLHISHGGNVETFKVSKL